MSDVTPELPFPPAEERERWLPIIDYEGLYEISDLGRVRSLDRLNARGWRIRGIMRKLTPHAAGYPTVPLSDRDGNKRLWLVHRLVLLTFVGPCPEGMEALHGRGGPADCRLVNLKWGTPKENNAVDKVRDGTLLYGERNPVSRHSAEVVAEARRRRVAGERPSAIARALGLPPSTVTNITTGYSRRHDGDPALIVPAQRQPLEVQQSGPRRNHETAVGQAQSA